jgi:hypothetical protein
VRNSIKKSARAGAGYVRKAEGMGFEPMTTVRPCRFSRPVRSTRLRHPSAPRAAGAAAAALLPDRLGRALVADAVEYSC